MGGPVRAKVLGADQYGYTDVVQLSDTARGVVSHAGVAPHTPEAISSARIDVLA
jgi:hypothetical protein